MPNRITNIAIPATVQVGKQFDVTVDYTSDDDDDLGIAYRGNFEGQPGTVALEAGAQRKTFTLTIVRAGAADACRIEFQFGNQWVSLVAVT